MIHAHLVAIICNVCSHRHLIYKKSAHVIATRREPKQQSSPNVAKDIENSIMAIVGACFLASLLQPTSKHYRLMSRNPLRLYGNRLRTIHSDSELRPTFEGDSEIFAQLARPTSFYTMSYISNTNTTATGVSYSGRNLGYWLSKAVRRRRMDSALLTALRFNEAENSIATLLGQLASSSDSQLLARDLQSSLPATSTVHTNPRPLSRFKKMVVRALRRSNTITKEQLRFSVKTMIAVFIKMLSDISVVGIGDAISEYSKTVENFKVCVRTEK
jgi:hypothetical protein